MIGELSPDCLLIAKKHKDQIQIIKESVLWHSLNAGDNYHSSQDDIRMLALSNGFLATICGNTVKIWNPNDHYKIVHQELHQDKIELFKELTNGILVTHSSSQIKFWDPASHYCSVKTFPVSSNVGYAIEELDDDLLATINENLIVIWDLKRETIIQTLQHDDEKISSLFHTNGIFYSSSYHLQENSHLNVKIWEMNTIASEEVDGIKAKHSEAIFCTVKSGYKDNIRNIRQ